MLWPTAVVATDDPASSIFSVGAFGTLGVVHSDQDKADFVAQPSEAVGVGHTRRWSVDVDSLAGAQVTANLAPRLSAVIQVVSQQTYDASYRPQVNWANLKYQFTPDFSMRLGRTTLGSFLLTDSRDVGFANPWVRLPIELYGLLSVTNNDGLDTRYRLALGTASNTFQVTVGRTSFRYPVPNSNNVGSGTATDQISVVNSYEQGFATLRATYGQAHVSIPSFDVIFDTFRQFGTLGAGIADRYDTDDHIISYFGMSASYEPGDWFTMAEWGRVNAHSVLVQKTGWYISGGYRCGQVTPYVTYAQVRANGNTSDPGLNLSILPPPLVAPAESLNAALNASLASIASQRTISVGTRWDITHNIDLKFQLDRIHLAADSQGWLTNIQPGFRLGSSLDLVSATLDFVF
jgi:hypothetical protein